MSAEPNLVSYVAPALCVGARISGWMTFTPFLGHAALPASVKAGLTIALTALLYPVVAGDFSMSTMPGPVMIAGELGVGMLMGLCMQLVFDGIQLGGQIVGTQLGFSMANLIDPMSQVETTVISVFHQSIALIIFLQMDVHHRLLQALGRSFHYLPAGTAFHMLIPAPQLMRAATGMWLVAIEIAAPVMLATMLTDVTLAYLSRMSPQFPVMLMGFSLKGMLGFGVIGATVGLWPWLFERHFLAALSTAEHLLIR
jgi:flagellar biosynthetic protein FliR